MNHLILDDDTNGIQPFQSQTCVVITSLDKILLCKHSNVSWLAALSCFTLCFC